MGRAASACVLRAGCDRPARDGHSGGLSRRCSHQGRASSFPTAWRTRRWRRIGGGRALAGGVWPTLLAAPLMAAVTASCLSFHDPGRLAHAMALAISGISGRLGRTVGASTGRWFLLGEAVLRGLLAAEAAGQG